MDQSYPPPPAAAASELEGVSSSTLTARALKLLLLQEAPLLAAVEDSLTWMAEGLVESIRSRGERFPPPPPPWPVLH